MAKDSKSDQHQAEVNNPSKGELILYNPDDSIRLEVHLEQETVWLTQQQMVALFGSSKSNISEHISKIYSSHELSKSATVRKFRTVQQEGDRLITRVFVAIMKIYSPKFCNFAPDFRERRSAGRHNSNIVNPLKRRSYV